MDNIQIKVSVIMPAYNCAEYILQAMRSVYEQTSLESIELIVIDNGSTDDTLKIVEQERTSWKEKQNEKRVLKILKNPIKGASTSRNLGMRHATGEYIAFLDADDWWELTKLEKQLALFNSDSACKLVCSARELMHADGTSTGRIIHVAQKVTYKQLLKHNQINCSSVLLDAKVAKAHPMEHEDSHEDYIMWLQILQKYQYALGVDEPLLKTRLSEGGKSRNKVKSAMMTWKVYRYMGFSFVKSCWCFVHYMVAGVMKYYG